MKNILLMGNPNVGKSAVFSRLTGADVTASNYPGTTVDFSEGHAKINGEKYEIIDVPGAYSLEPSNKAEEVATKMLEDGDIVINVVDATNLERNLNLTFELLEKNIPMIIALNMWDETQHQGIKIDTNQLQKELEVPVIPTTALTGEGFKELVNNLKNAKKGNQNPKTEDERWKKVGEIVEKTQTIKPKQHTLKEKISEATIKPHTGIPIAILIIFLIFNLIRYIGETIIAHITEPLFNTFYTPIIMNINQQLGQGPLQNILIGDLFQGQISYMESMGLLTTGIFVPFASVLPYIIAFYFGLSILEDTGYLPRLSTLLDNIFHRLGMHGHGIVPVFLGLGCNVPGVLSTRTLESEKQRFISATLLSISVPCMAQTAMIFGILAPYGLKYIYLVYGTLFLLYIGAGLTLNKLIGGESPEIFLEIPPYRRPTLKVLLQKTYMRVRWFIKEAVPYLFLGILILNVLYQFRIIQNIGNLTSPIIVGLFGLPEGAVSALVIGFLRKDLAIGMLLGLGMKPLQLVIASTILTIYFPCAATFATLVKELGPKDLLKSITVMITAVLIIGTLMNIILL